MGPVRETPSSSNFRQKKELFLALHRQVLQKLKDGTATMYSLNSSMPNTKPVIDSPLGVAYIRHHAAKLPVDLEVIGAMT